MTSLDMRVIRQHIVTDDRVAGALLSVHVTCHTAPLTYSVSLGHDLLTSDLDF